MKTVEECTQEYIKVVNMFKKSCCLADLTPTTRSSIEECIIGLKEVVRSDDGKCGMKVCKYHRHCISPASQRRGVSYHERNPR